MREGTGLELELSRSNSHLCCMLPQANHSLSLGFHSPSAKWRKINATLCLASILPIFIVVQRKKKYFLIYVCIVPNILKPLGPYIIQ